MINLFPFHKYTKKKKKKKKKKKNNLIIKIYNTFKDLSNHILLQWFLRNHKASYLKYSYLTLIYTYQMHIYIY